MVDSDTDRPITLAVLVLCSNRIKTSKWCFLTSILQDSVAQN